MISARQAVQTVEEYLNRVNEHNLEGALACLADDFELRFLGTDYTMSRAQAADALAWDVCAEGEIGWQIVGTAGNEVTVKGRETNDFLQLVGLAELHFQSVYAITPRRQIGTQIMEVDWGPVSLDQAMKPLIDWATAHAPRELAEVYPGGRMVYNCPMARSWIDLARRWRDSQGVG